MSEINQEVNFGPVGKPPAPVNLEVHFSSHDDGYERSRELYELYDAAETGFLRNNHYFGKSAAEFIKKEKPGMIILNELPLYSSITDISYYLPE